jgi:hypothetical protein
VSEVKVTECEITSAGAEGEKLPYMVLVPYSTCELEAWSVVQTMVAEVVVMPLVPTLLIAGGASAALLAVVDWFAIAVL